VGRKPTQNTNVMWMKLVKRHLLKVNFQNKIILKNGYRIQGKMHNQEYRRIVVVFFEIHFLSQFSKELKLFFNPADFSYFMPHGVGHGHGQYKYNKKSW
jgi:hypothetical protein